MLVAAAAVRSPRAGRLILTTYRLSPDCATHTGQTWRFTGLVMDFDIRPYEVVRLEVVRHQGGLRWQGGDTSLKRSLRSCGRSKTLGREVPSTLAYLLICRSMFFQRGKQSSGKNFKLGIFGKKSSL